MREAFSERGLELAIARREPRLHRDGDDVYVLRVDRCENPLFAADGILEEVEQGCLALRRPDRNATSGLSCPA